jgi:hypothetical protein
VGSYTDAGLANGVTYYYRLAFVNDCGTGGQSSEVQSVPGFVNPWTPSMPEATGFSPPEE